MMKEKETSWNKVMKNARDIIYIIMFLAVAFGWFKSSTSKKVMMETTIQNNTKAIDNNTDAIEKFNEYMLEQNKLNGKVIQHMIENP